VVRAVKLASTPVPGVFVAESTAFEDHRGVFSRLFCEQELTSAVGNRHIVQINHSRTAARGAVRGLHYQNPPCAEMKLVRCLEGRIWDVAVDLRTGSRTFLQWHAEELTPQSGRMLIIPEGCAHGFQVLEPDSEVLYLHTAAYAPELEGGVRYDDPSLAITWPLHAVDVSARDQRHERISARFAGVAL
jgi:dTDP-4-dehydrorhamnose 3,5-epimerase